jgi:NAD(P)H-hydrate repair Nnr-like enzyme with NAD(P)H-hydrate epimerase domain
VIELRSADQVRAAEERAFLTVPPGALMQQAAMALLQAQSLGADKEKLQSQLEGWLEEDLETAMTALNI